MGTPRSMRPLRPPLLLLALVLATLVGCGGDGPHDDAEVSHGNDERTGEVKGLSMAAVTNGEGVAAVVGTLLNESDEPDRLVGVEATSERGPVRAVLAEEVDLPKEEPLRLARENLVTLVSEVLVPGRFITVTFTFAESPALEMQVPVEPHGEAYADIEIVRPPDGDVTPG